MSDTKLLFWVVGLFVRKTKRPLAYSDFLEIAASVLQKFGTSNEQMVNIDMMIKMVTQNCYEKLGKNDAIKTPLAGKAYVITPEVKVSS